MASCVTTYTLTEAEAADRAALDKQLVDAMLAAGSAESVRASCRQLRPTRRAPAWVRQAWTW